MAEYCKVCGVGLKASNTVDYRPGSCRDCELERKKLYSGMSVDFSYSRASKKSKKSKKAAKKTKAKSAKRGRKKDPKKLAKKLKLKKQKLLKAKKLKAKKLLQMKRLAKIRAQREKKKKKLRQKLERLRKLRVKKALKLKQQRKKQKERERKAREQLKARIKKAKDRERKLLKKERERLRKEKEKIRRIVRENKEKVRAEKRAEKDRIRAEKQRLRLEKQKEKERLKKAKEAAKNAILQAKEAARQAAQESRRLREEAKKPPIVSVVTKVKDLQPPPDVKVIGPDSDDKSGRAPQPTKVVDPKKPNTFVGGKSLVQSGTIIPANAPSKKEKELLKQSASAHHNEEVQKEIDKLQKDVDPIIGRYNPYNQQSKDPDAPRAPSPTPWLKSNFSVVKGDFKETGEEGNEGTTSGLSEQQVKDIIDRVKGEHKKKSS